MLAEARLARGWIFAYFFDPMTALSSEFSDVTVQTKANIYFDGKVVSHSVILPDGSKKTLGLIYPGEFYFGTDAPERMEIISGHCVVKLDGSEEEVAYAEGQYFEVSGKSGFNITVSDGICEYICSFIG